MSGGEFVSVTLTRAELAALAEAVWPPRPDDSEALAGARSHVYGAALLAEAEAVTPQ